MLFNCVSLKLHITLCLGFWFTSLSAQDIQTGRIAYYPFSGNTNDHVGNNHGLAQGPLLVSDRFGNNNSAYRFDGVDDYIEIANNSLLNFSAEEDFTISLWVSIAENQYDLRGHNNEILGQWEAHTRSGYPYAIRYWNKAASVSNQNKIFTMRYDSERCGNNPTITATCKISSDEWHHLVMRKKGNRISYFQDGQLMGAVEDNTDYRCNTQNNNPIFVGKRDLNARHFTGKIDDVSFYNRALEEIDIQALLKENNWSPPVNTFDPKFESFYIKEQTEPALIDNINHKIEVEVFCSSQLDNLIPEFILPDGVNASVNGISQISGQTLNNFTHQIEYVLQSDEHCFEKVWTVLVKKETVSLEPSFNSFYLSEQTKPAEINKDAKTIEVEVACSLDLSGLVAEFTLTDGTFAVVSGVQQQSGVSKNNFIESVEYSLISNDGCVKQSWEVFVTTEKSTNLPMPSFKNFKIPNQIDSSKINSTNRTIEVTFLCGTDISNLIPFYTLENAKIAKVSDKLQQSGSTKNDFSTPVVYTISDPETCTLEDWTVIVSYQQINLEANSLSKEPFFIPNVITLNNDGINDDFIVGDFFLGSEFFVFNRYGKRVFYRPKYDNDFYGEGLSAGVYFYLLRNPCLTSSIKGHITILKK